MRRSALLKIADLAFTVAGLAALMIARFNPSRFLFWVGIVLGVLSIAGFFLLRNAAKRRREEILLEMDPKDWTVEEEAGTAFNAWLA